ncbi:ATP-binding cassette domain-containing protein [Patescibacteria group bacterium]|jgi:putative ABC transport system ATP-binding protein|nr:ATP-binding cassette domain-containing protein [Patescibacteria group bacterium]
MDILTTTHLSKTYHIGDVTVEAVRDVSFAVAAGEYVAITGRSGAGKSTLLYQLSLLDTPSAGSVAVKGEDTSHYSERRKTALRLATFGYVFQDYALIPELTAIENVKVPLLMQGCYRGCDERAAEILAAVGIGDRMHNRPSQLSGGQQQRVAIARALVARPSVLFADEPTANLDTETGETIMTLLDDLNASGQTIVMVTHEDIYAQRAGRLIEMQDGKIIRDEAQ